MKTPYRVEKEKRDMAILNDWNALTGIPGQSRSMVTAMLMEKYGLHSSSAVWTARKRAERRLEGGK